MSPQPMRPRFHMIFTLPPEQAMEKIEECVKERNEQFRLMKAHPHIQILVSEKEQHFWSPCFSLEFEKCSKGTCMYGLVGPHPGVWTMFMAFYTMLAFGAFVGMSLGVSQWMAKEYAWGFWLLPVLGVLAVGVYLASLAGQRLAAPQTQAMRSLVMEALPEPEEVGDGMLWLPAHEDESNA
ncbi:MAG: hypothetical protein H6728_08730 [Myxococcales bacterium]|nr:hypothetical protein [Myxococcales bacterium]